MKRTISNIFLFSILILPLFLLVSCESTDLKGGSLDSYYFSESDFANSIFGQAIQEFSEAGAEIPPKEEYEIGRAVAANLLKTYTIYEDAPDVTDYLNKICKVITFNSPAPYIYKDYCVAILDTDEITAISSPGGHIFISKGMLKCVNSEDVIAAVIAHEIAHIQLRHGVKVVIANRKSVAVANVAKKSFNQLKDVLIDKDNYYIDMAGFDTVFLNEEISSLYENTEKLIVTLFSEGFSKEQEFKADTEALLLMHDAGYDPEAMVEMLKLTKKHAVKGEGWDRTHPNPKNRISQVKENLKKNRKTYGYRSYNRRARIKRFGKIISEIK